MQLSIEKLVYGGDGLARLPADDHGRGKALFMPFVLPGEQVEAAVLEEKPGFARGRAENILKASPHRSDPACPYFQRCGGCHYQHSAYDAQLEYKAAILRENLRRIAKLELEAELSVLPSPPWNYRNRTRLKVRHAPEFGLGYHRFNSHELLPVEQCPISSPLLNRAIAQLWQAGRDGRIPGEFQEVELFADAADTQMLVEAYTAAAPREKADQWAEDLRQILPEAAGAVVFRAGITGNTARLGASGVEGITYKTSAADYRVSAGAFFQVNRFLVSQLIEAVTQGRGGRSALDLYAGGGLFAAPLARSFAQVIAVESSQISHSDLLYNAPANVKAVFAQVEQYLEKASRRLSFDLVVADPPRGGLGPRVVRSLAALRPPAMVYVSCDPATLARDLAPLLAAGYRVERAHLVDLFPQTFHLETIVHLAL